MPKKLPGLTVEFAVVADDGRAELGNVRAPESIIALKAMKAIAKTVKKMKPEPEPVVSG